jgi:hypothetical protein
MMSTYNLRPLVTVIRGFVPLTRGFAPLARGFVTDADETFQGTHNFEHLCP